MPWQECYKMDERLRFVAQLLDGENMAVLCREFDVSRKTGYKIFARYKDCGLEGPTDHSRRPYRHGMRLPFQIEKLIVQLNQEHPSWGALKIREKIRRLQRPQGVFPRCTETYVAQGCRARAESRGG
jgi:putative transposase